MANSEKVLEILSKAYQIEADGYTFYAMTAERSDKPAVKELFEKLASDEVQHQAFLKNVSKDYGKHGAGAFAITRRPVDMGVIAQQVFTGRFREQAAGAQFELAVLSIGMTLETNAMNYFGDAAKQATEAEIRGFYGFLFDWEKQHYDALQNLSNAVRADAMADRLFSPF
jgi:rubrerythrin